MSNPCCSITNAGFYPTHSHVRSGIPNRQNALSASEHSLNTDPKMHEADLNALGNSEASTEFKNVPSVIPSFHQSSLNPSTHLYSSVHHSSLSAPSSFSADSCISLSRPLCLQLTRVEELSFSSHLSHLLLPVLTFHKRKKRHFFKGHHVLHSSNCESVKMTLNRAPIHFSYVFLK